MRFVVSGVFIKENGHCNLNIQNKLTYIIADSKEEAIGIFTKEGFEQFPQHSLFIIPTILNLNEIEHGIKQEELGINDVVRNINEKIQNTD